MSKRKTNNESRMNKIEWKNGNKRMKEQKIKTNKP